MYSACALLPPPRRLCFCQSLFVCLRVSKITPKVMEGSFWKFRECREWQKLQVIQFWGWPGRNPGFWFTLKYSSTLLLGGGQRSLSAFLVFSCILLSAFSFLLTCIRNPASIWDRTGVEVVVGNCLPVYLTPLSKYGASKIMGSRPWPFWVTWRPRSRDHSTRGGRLSMGGP